MSLDFWTKTSGTWINVATVLLGTGLGLVLRGRLPLKMQQIITQGLGLITLFVGLSMAGSVNKVESRIDGVILALLAIVMGGLLGEWWRLEERLEALGNWLKRRFKGKGSFTEGFMAASLLFCVGPMTLIGSLNNGLTGDNTLLLLKAVMDGLAAIALTSSFGIGVGFSVLVVLLYQGGVSLAAGLLAQNLADPASSPAVLLITGVGGLMILGLGLNLLEVARVRVASFLPALLLAPLLVWLTSRIG
ncbi:MAG: DUF554 domain-containing protein [Leptolyngbya sp. IPPAS B-1204]|uniref:DUF554 domain-containing protein n=1 Tax=Leptolyngbya sp. NK1-12 TaxID=2547451 RepID=A0AA96WEL6_9CYAN|nr:DUF554 domain-containing protein [Leptolyngbya sp. NK1-12]RNJ69109.1 MAG: DUF554 domain-containing protein [Leptolyngbya sp. IPPAS B-1204]WNZ23903.1 DUF554 domain-containing protein [Leptolyngbya sp. NK1-12]